MRQTKIERLQFVEAIRRYHDNEHLKNYSKNLKLGFNRKNRRKIEQKVAKINLHDIDHPFVLTLYVKLTGTADAHLLECQGELPADRERLLNGLKQLESVCKRLEITGPDGYV